MTEQQQLFDIPHPGEYEIPDNYDVRVCASCGAAITWLTTGNGKAIPVNVAKVREFDGKIYGITHFATCPHGREWRRNK